MSIERKIKKLLALSKSPEPAEASLALQRALKLARKHRIEILYAKGYGDSDIKLSRSKNPQNSIVAKILYSGSTEQWKRDLVYEISKASGCFFYFFEGESLNACGEVESLKLCKTLSVWSIKTVEKLLGKFHQKSKKAKTDYLKGLVSQLVKNIQGEGGTKIYLHSDSQKLKEAEKFFMDLFKEEGFNEEWTTRKAPKNKKTFKKGEEDIRKARKPRNFKF